MNKSKPNIIRYRRTACPYCGYSIDAAAEAFDRKTTPAPGDVSMCIACGEWLVFHFDVLRPDGLTLRAPTQDELIEIGGNPVCRRVREVWVMMPDKPKPGPRP